MSRKINFSAGPCTLPLPVLEELQANMVDFEGNGFSLIESSHRWPTYDKVHMECLALLRELMEIPDNYKIMLLGGGATLQFSMIPMNLLADGSSCDFTVTGAWAKKALADTNIVGKANIVFDGKDGNYTALPTSITTTPGAKYLHITSNETIGGVEWMDFPDVDIPIVADMSSDILSRPLPIEKFGMIYAGAQKNLGPAGVTVVIIRDDLLETCSDKLPAYLAYKTHAPKDSMYNTPPVFPIWAMKVGLEQVKAQGGAAQMEKNAIEKANLIYGAIEANSIYHCPVDQSCRSRMNVVFTMPTPELEAKFIAEAAELGMVGLKGHKSVGGCRASIYNAIPLEGVQALANFMNEFAAKNS
jgi:phosphoserine aminotransferase